MNTLIHFQQPDVVEQDIIVAPKTKLKILFYHAGGWKAWLYPAALQLKTYIDLFYQDVADQLEWLIPIQQEVSDEELVRHIEQTDTDILCTSHYLWNHEFLTSQLSRVRNKLKNTIKLVAGGPSIDVNNNKDFFEQHPYIDYAVYGAGEQAFADIIDHLVNEKPMIAFNTSNCAWKNHNTGKIVVADYKFVKMIETSPFVHCAEMFGHMVADAKKKNVPVSLPYTLTRGCPYSCTFCDWNSGLGNKVSRRKNTYQQEIDLFQQVGIKDIYLSDANVGQYDEDIEMIEYFAQKNLEENAGFHLSGNFSKLKKENNLKIFHTMARGKLINKTFNFSIQDTNKEILDNINRPDVGWETHVSMAKELQEKYPNLIVKAQLIYGLPGQTPASWKHTLDQVTQQNILPVIFLNEPLPASPAIYDPEYQQRFQFEYIHSNRLTQEETIYSSKIPKNSSSFTQQDLVEMNLIGTIYVALSLINFALRENNAQLLNISLIVDEFLTSVHYKNLYNNLWYNWTVDNNFYFTINFCGKPDQISDGALATHLFKVDCFLRYITNFIPNINRSKLAQAALNSKFQKILQEIYSDVD